MWLRSIDIKDFRNYRHTSVTLVNGLNVLHGPNGAGKTNFLEAVGLLSHGKSLRFRNVDDLIRDGSDTGHLTGTFVADHGNTVTVRCHLDRGTGKRVVVNGKPAARISDVFRLVPTVQCFENDTFLVQGPPTARRSFLDCLCAQLHAEYLQRHNEFREVLVQRNAALRSGRLTGPMKRALDSVFAQKAAPVTVMRLRALRQFAAVVQEHRATFAEEVELGVDERYLSGDDELEATTERLLQRLERSSNEEQRFHRTCVGPHRDSFEFVIGTDRIRCRSSRGQIKNMVLRIKMSEFHLLRTVLGRQPIVILDDVFAEMDATRRTNLQSLLDLGAQVFWASTGLMTFDAGADRTFLRLDIADGDVGRRHEVLAAA